MKIVFDCRSVFTGMGGIGRATLGLAQHLPAALPPEARVIYLIGARRPEPGWLPEPSERVQHLAVDAAMIDPLFEQIQLPRILEELEADLYHGTCFAVPMDARCAQVSTVHDVVFRRHPELVDEPLRSYLDRWTEVACRLADLVVTVSEFSRGEIAELYARDLEEIEVVPNAVDPSFFREPRSGKCPTGPILYVGSIEAKKNVAGLVSGFARLVEDHPELDQDLVLVGGRGGAGFDLRGLLETLPHGTRARVHPLGHVSDEQLRELYAEASLFCYLSEYEGFGLPPLEAMAAGVPCLVSDRGSLPEVTHGAASTADPHDSSAVALEMASLLSDPDLRRDRVRQGLRVAGRYSWAASAKRLAAVYRRALECSLQREGSNQ